MVSISCAWITGPRTVTIGSPGKIGVPSGIAGELEIPQVPQEFLLEHVRGFQIGDVVVRKLQVFNIVNQLLYAGHDSKAAIVWDMSEKHVKIYNGVPVAIGKIAIGHGDFIEIGQHCEISRGLFLICHGNISTNKVPGWFAFRKGVLSRLVKQHARM